MSGAVGELRLSIATGTSVAGELVWVLVLDADDAGEGGRH